MAASSTASCRAAARSGREDHLAGTLVDQPNCRYGSFLAAVVRRCRRGLGPLRPSIRRAPSRVSLPGPTGCVIGPSRRGHAKRLQSSCTTGARMDVLACGWRATGGPASTAMDDRGRSDEQQRSPRQHTCSRRPAAAAAPARVSCAKRSRSEIGRQSAQISTKAGRCQEVTWLVFELLIGKDKAII